MKRYISILAVIAAMTAPAFSQSGNDEEQIIYKDDVNSIKLNKEVAESDNGEYLITLSSFVTGTRETHESEVRPPMDFSIVLDMSGSMVYTINQNERYLLPRVQLAYIDNGNQWVNVNGSGCAIYNPNRCSSSEITSSKRAYLYYKHSDGNYYYIHRYSFTWNGKNKYCLYYETDETMTDPVTKITWKKRYFLGGNSIDGYDARSFAEGMEIPVTLNEGGDPTSWSGYSLVEDYVSSNEADILYDGPLYSSARFGALLNALESFTDVVYEDDAEHMTDITGHHRIGFVKFADGSSSSVGNDWFVQWGYYHSNYSQILYPLSSISEKDDMMALVRQMMPGCYTNTDLGVYWAKQMMDAAVEDGRKKVVVLFTDGKPQNASSSSFNNAVANRAIQYAKQLKDYGCEVYVVGLTSEATQECVQFMEYVSSDYPSSASMTSGGNKSFDKYFSLASNGSSLNTIFESIASNATRTEIGYSLTETNQVVFDALTKHFLLPEDVTSTDAHRIGVYTRDFLGIVDGAYNFDPTLKPLPGARVCLGGDNNREIIVSGFDFAENWCGLWRNFNWLGQMNDVWQGKELVIKIPIIVDPANPGGANMTTNEATSGIYNDDGTGHPDFDHPLKPFPIPEVSLPNIVVVKNGMKANNSAIFVVTRVNADGTLDSTYEPFTVMAIADGTGTAKIRLKLVGEGRYKVSEQSWSWAYDSTPTATYAKDDGHTSVQGNTITRNVLAATADSTENGTLYIFTNTDRKNIPAHDEDAVNNVFFTPQVVIQ